MDSNLKIKQNKSFAIIININKANYNFYRYYILDTGFNTYVINHYEGSSNVREALELAILNKRRDIYRIKAYGDIKVNFTTPDKPLTIILFNIVYVFGYLINMVAIRRLSRDGVY